MLAPGGVEPLQQGLLVGIQEDDFDLDPGITQPLVDVLEIGQFTGQVAGIDTDRHFLQTAGGFVGHGFPGQGKQQADGQVVYAIEPQVFQYVQCRTFARPGPATDDDQLHG